MPSTVNRPQSVAKTRLLARDVERIVLRRIAEDRYPVGGRIPSCEAFGREIGANKNTVSKAYRALSERGYLTATAGRGTFVTARPSGSDSGTFVSEIESLLTLVVENAYAAGLSLDDLEEILAIEIRQRYDRSHVRVAFVECNLTEATKFGRELQELLGVPIEPLLLDDLLTQTEKVTAHYDLIALDLSHFADAQNRLRAVPSAHAEIVPLLTLPDPDSLAEVARLAPDIRLGVLTETPEALSALTGLVQAINPALRTTAALVATPETEDVVERSDVLLVTEAVQKHLDGRLPRKPLIEAPFKLDGRSVERLGQRITELRRAAATTLRS